LGNKLVHDVFYSGLVEVAAHNIGNGFLEGLGPRLPARDLLTNPDRVQLKDKFLAPVFGSEDALVVSIVFSNPGREGADCKEAGEQQEKRQLFDFLSEHKMIVVISEK